MKKHFEFALIPLQISPILLYAQPENEFLKNI